MIEIDASQNMGANIIEKVDFLAVEDYNSFEHSLVGGLDFAIPRILAFLIKEHARPESLTFSVSNWREIDEKEHKYKYNLCWTLQATPLDECSWVEYCGSWFKRGGFLRGGCGIPNLTAPPEILKALGFLK